MAPPPRPAPCANKQPLTPCAFLARSALVYPQSCAVVFDHGRLSWAQLAARCCALATGLRSRGVRRGQVVAVIAPNSPQMLECHFGVPLAGAVLCTINTRLDAESIGFQLSHSQAALVLVDTHLMDKLSHANLRADQVIVLDDAAVRPLESAAPRQHAQDYESLLREAPAQHFDQLVGNIEDEDDTIALNYTSGTTGNPKGVEYSHRATYLKTLGNAIAWEMRPQPVYLWTVPMFHCNGWFFAWTVSMLGGMHVCMRDVDPVKVFDAIATHHVTHLCAAPTVFSMLLETPPEKRKHFDHRVQVMVGGAAPPKAVLKAVEQLGFDVLHTYGLTEVLGPATLCERRREWAQASDADRLGFIARQGVPYHVLERVVVVDAASGVPVPHDGTTRGEVVMRGNTVMKGYLRNPKATSEAFAGGWFHSGDVAVVHPDGYIEIKDRIKDVIISGGENISSLEVEQVLHSHPSVLHAAVVAMPHPKWGESPCAFVQLRGGAPPLTDAQAIAFCRDHMAGFKVPRVVVFGDIPKTATGKIQKHVLRERAMTLGKQVASKL